MILAGGCFLAFGAAFGNLCLFIKSGVSVSHLTGDFSRLALDIASLGSQRAEELVRVTTAAICFLLGAVTSGYVIHHPSLDFARPYGRTITAIGLLLLAAHQVSALGLQGLAVGLAAFAFGLQNALATHYRGIILRTTHLTGLVTDLGVCLGMKLRGFEIAWWKILVPLALIVFFLLGGLSAGLLYLKQGEAPILLAGLIYVIAGLSWTITKHLFLRWK